MRKMVAVVVVVLAGVHVAEAEPCRPDPKPGKLLVKSRGKVEVNQSCEGGYVAFAWTKADVKTEQVARCGAQACTVIATWRNTRNCDAGMCDHFSEVDQLLIADVVDIDADAKPDVLLTFRTTHGDQGRVDHRLVFWLSKQQALKELGRFEGMIDYVSAIPGGVAVTSHDGFDPDVTPTTRCFARTGPIACPAKP
jgi:hypothetical protein